MTATLDYRNGRWFAYSNGVIGSWGTKDDALRELEQAGWLVRMTYE